MFVSAMVPHRRRASGGGKPGAGVTGLHREGCLGAWCHMVSHGVTERPWSSPVKPCPVLNELMASHDWQVKLSVPLMIDVWWSRFTYVHLDLFWTSF